MDLGILTINTLYKRSVLSTPATRIWSPTDGSHRSALYHGFGEATAAGISAVNSDHDYIYITEFQIWKYNKESELQFFLWVVHLWARIPLIQTRRTQKFHIWTWLLLIKKMPAPKPLTRPTESSKRNGKSNYKIKRCKYKKSYRKKRTISNYAQSQRKSCGQHHIYRKE